MSIKVFCDACKKELIRNMVDERLVVENGQFKAEVLIAKDGTTNAGDLCLDCLLKMLTTKPKKPRSDKGTKRVGKRLKPEPVTVITPELREMEEGLNSEGLTLLKPTKKKVKGKPDISTLSITVGQKDKPHTLKLGEVAVASKTLKEGVTELLGLCGIDQKYTEDAPESEGKRNLLDILK